MDFSPPEEMPNLSENWEPEMTEAAPVAVPAGLMGFFEFETSGCGVGFFLGLLEEEVVVVAVVVVVVVGCWLLVVD